MAQVNSFEELPEKYRLHLAEMGVYSIEDLARTREEQRKSEELLGGTPICWDCYFAARALGLEPDQIEPPNLEGTMIFETFAARRGIKVLPGPHTDQIKKRRTSEARSCRI